MKNVVPMSEIRGSSLGDPIHCHGFMSALLIADRHCEGRRNKFHLLHCNSIQYTIYLSDTDHVVVDVVLTLGQR